MSKRCTDCDRADCPMLQPAPQHLHYRERREAMTDWETDCARHTVNWRTRALAAESEAKRLRETLTALGCQSYGFPGENCNRNRITGTDPDPCIVCRALTEGAPTRGGE